MPARRSSTLGSAFARAGSPYGAGQDSRSSSLGVTPSAAALRGELADELTQRSSASGRDHPPDRYVGRLDADVEDTGLGHEPAVRIRTARHLPSRSSPLGRLLSRLRNARAVDTRISTNRHRPDNDEETRVSSPPSRTVAALALPLRRRKGEGFTTSDPTAAGLDSQARCRSRWRPCRRCGPGSMG